MFPMKNPRVILGLWLEQDLQYQKASSLKHALQENFF